MNVSTLKEQLKDTLRNIFDIIITRGHGTLEEEYNKYCYINSTSDDKKEEYIKCEISKIISNEKESISYDKLVSILKQLGFTETAKKNEHLISNIETTLCQNMLPSKDVDIGRVLACLLPFEQELNDFMYFQKNCTSKTIEPSAYESIVFPVLFYPEEKESINPSPSDVIDKITPSPHSSPRSKQTKSRQL